MRDSKPSRPAPLAASKATQPAGPEPARGGAGAPEHEPRRTGHVVHDERGNAVWDWLKETSRIAINATSRLLKRLESPELKVEDTDEQELRLTPEEGTDAGGGYDPYNQSNKRRAVKPVKK